MFLPKYPDNPTPPPAHHHTPTDPAPTPVRRPGLPVAVDRNTLALVVVGGVVLTALLAAVAVAAVVLRSLLNEHHRR